jgi:hypothetical protein
MIPNPNLTTEQKIDAIYREVLNGDKTLDFLNVIGIALGIYNTFLNLLFSIEVIWHILKHIVHLLNAHIFKYINIHISPPKSSRSIT